MLSFVTSRLHAIFTIKAFNREPVEKQKYNSSSEKLFQLGVRYFNWYGFLSALIPVSLYAVIALVFYFSHQQRVLDKAHFPAHALLVYIMILLSLIPHFRRFLAVTLVWQAGNVSISKILRIFNEKTEPRISGVERKISNGTLELHDLSFIHANGNKVLEHFSALLPEHSITRISGEHRSGKSTLYKLLLGIYPVSSGSISLDGVELNDDNIFYFRKNITIVSDEYPLLGKTVFEAVSYSRKEEKREKALKVITDLGLFRELEQDEILDYPLTLAGGNLSSVQRRQLLFVRSILTRKKVILLDEPFTGMDANTKRHIVEMLNDLKRKRNIIIVSKEWPDGLLMDQQVEM
jgi:ABC-type multidrug transport system fused ATPase/permease subunit